MEALLRRQLKLGCLLAVLDVVDAAAASATALHAATASVTTATTLLEADLVGAGVTALAACPRQLLFTVAGTTPADAPATATVTGWTKGSSSKITETVTLPQTATTVSTSNFFTKIESITQPAGDGTGATVAIGTTAALGLPAKAKGRGAAGAVFRIIAEHVDGAVPTAGSITSPATHKPFGSYTPNSVPNGARDYLLTYEAVFPKG